MSKFEARKQLTASLIVPCFNAERYLSACLESLDCQDYPNVEIVLVDDGSTDGTRKLLERVRDNRRYKIISCQNSGGPSRPRNLGIAASSGDVLFFFDSDDLAHPSKVSESMKVFATAPINLGLLFTDFSVIDSEGNLTSESSFTRRYSTIRELVAGSSSRGGFEVLECSKAYSGLLAGNFVGTSSVAIRRTVFDDVGLFDERLLNGDDYEMWLRIARSHHFVYLDRQLHQYRVHTGGVTARSALLTAPNRIKVLERQREYALTWQDRIKIRRWLSGNWNQIGGAYRGKRNWWLAIRSYVKSLLTFPGKAALRGLGASILRIT